MAADAPAKTPILLLKTKSAPVDVYEDFFSAFDAQRYEPLFVPVLEHRFQQHALDQVRHHLTNRGFVPRADRGLATYGAIIFTSQRAVEAFSQVVGHLRQEGAHCIEELLPPSVPLYVVGPATARGLKALNLPCPVLGQDTGTGDVLAPFILHHYNGLYASGEKPPILFLVGDKRRDIIPKTLQSQVLAPEMRVKVDELVIYETGEMASFKNDFVSLIHKHAIEGVSRQWVVVFSPTGCRAMLEGLGLLDEQSGRVQPGSSRPDTLVATIGPTTRDYLINEFGFTPHVSAQKPSAEGIAEGIIAFLASSQRI